MGLKASLRMEMKWLTFITRFKTRMGNTELDSHGSGQETMALLMQQRYGALALHKETGI